VLIATISVVWFYFGSVNLKLSLQCFVLVKLKILLMDEWPI